MKHSKSYVKQVQSLGVSYWTIGDLYVFVLDSSIYQVQTT